MSEIKHTHDGVEITYDEKENRWRFHLRGRERSAESLAKAKEFIDKPVVEKEEKTFVPIDAWWFSYSEGPRIVKVTSVAERGYGSLEYYWIKDGKDRSKRAAYELYPKTDKNDKLVSEVQALDSQLDSLREKRDEKKQKLDHL
jgi:hypothetical protein